MDVNDFKRYSAKVGEGSGVIFQPMNKRDYTYILTANHNLSEIKNERGQDKKHPLNEVNIFIPNKHEKEPIKIKVVENEIYFPHKEADIAILKIDFQEGFEKIYVNPSFNELSNSFICGYPDYLRKTKENLNEEYNSFLIKDYKSENNTSCRAQLDDSTKEQSQISGFSGGGIMKIENDYISLIGIQSEVTSQIPNGEIEFIPIKYFDDIINYPENENKLSLLLPPYMGAFKYLKDEIIKLEDALNPTLRNKIKSAFFEQMKFIGLNPYLIYKSKIGSRLLMDKNVYPFSKELWVSWLEYLLVLCFIENKEINIDDIENFFNQKRLIHSDTKLSWIEIIPELLKKNLQGLEDNATLIVSTNITPSSKNKRRFKNNVIQDIFSLGGGRSLGLLQIDQAKSIKSLKEIIHIKAFEIDCILESETTFNAISELNIDEIITELKNKINEFFEN